MVVGIQISWGDESTNITDETERAYTIENLYADTEYTITAKIFNNHGDFFDALERVVRTHPTVVDLALEVETRNHDSLCVSWSQLNSFESTELSCGEGEHVKLLIGDQRKMIEYLRPNATYAITANLCTMKRTCLTNKQRVMSKARPAPIEGVQVQSVSENSVDLTWQSNNNNKFKIMWNDGGCGGKTDRVNYTVENLQASTVYNITIHAVDQRSARVPNFALHPQYLCPHPPCTHMIF